MGDVRQSRFLGDSRPEMHVVASASESTKVSGVKARPASPRQAGESVEVGELLPRRPRSSPLGLVAWPWQPVGQDPDTVSEAL